MAVARMEHGHSRELIAAGSTASGATPSSGQHGGWLSSSSEYRGELHQPESPALSWPAVEFPPTFDAPALEHYSTSWGAPELPAPEAAAIGWDAPAPAWGDPGGSYDYAALPAPDGLSTQAELQQFLDDVQNTPLPAYEASADLQWLPAPEAVEAAEGENNDR